MKAHRLVLSVVLISLSTVAFAQTDAQKSFNQMKTLAGAWEGHVTTVPKGAVGDNADVLVSLRVTSRGNALVHEMKGAGTPDDPAHSDHPVTMIYLDGERLLLTHYCDAGNRPRMVASASPDGKRVEFAFLDLSGGNEHGHMYHAAFTIIDANHHTEDWTYMMPGNEPMHAHMDLRRTDDQSSMFGK